MGRIRKIKNASELIRDYPNFISKPKNAYFNNHNPLEIEIGAGKGIFLITKAIKNPDINFIGFEKDSTIVLKALRKINILNTKLNNLLFVNDSAINLNQWLNKKSIGAIYLNFPDPWPKKRHMKNRLTNSYFLQIYHGLLVDKGIIEFKTDNIDLYEYSLNSFNEFDKFKQDFATSNLYQHPNQLQHNIQTEYEQKFIKQNIAIKKFQFSKH